MTSTDTSDLFGDADVPAAPPSTQALKVSARQTGHKLTPAQQRFNKLLTRIHNLTEQMQLLDALLQKHHASHQKAVSALQLRFDELQKAMLLQLHTHLLSTKLTKAEKRDLTEIVQSLLLQTEHLNDAQLDALFQQYFSQQEQDAWAQEETESLEKLRDIAHAHLSEQELQDLPDDPEALLHLLLKKSAQEQMEQTASSRKPRKPTARQQQAQQEALDAKTVLRTVFRQLASALHPDREYDPAERERKTALMSQANAAYEKQDLATLLKLQLHTTALDADTINRMTDDKLNTMSVLLKQQVSTLEAELRVCEDRASAALGFALSGKSSEAWVQRKMRSQLEHLQEMTDTMQDDVDYVRDAQQLKAWIKEQRALSKQQASMDAFWDSF